MPWKVAKGDRYDDTAIAPHSTIDQKSKLSKSSLHRELLQLLNNDNFSANQTLKNRLNVDLTAAVFLKKNRLREARINQSYLKMFKDSYRVNLMKPAKYTPSKNKLNRNFKIKARNLSKIDDKKKLYGGANDTTDYDTHKIKLNNKFIDSPIVVTRAKKRRDRRPKRMCTAQESQHTLNSDLNGLVKLSNSLEYRHKMNQKMMNIYNPKSSQKSRMPSLNLAKTEAKAINILNSSVDLTQNDAICKPPHIKYIYIYSA